jgi:hypothetical protein
MLAMFFFLSLTRCATIFYLHLEHTAIAATS